MTCSERWPWFALSLLIATNCTLGDAPLAPMVIASVTPPAGYNGAEIPIEIHGAGFDFDAAQGPSRRLDVDSRFRIFLGATELETLERIDGATMRATIPRGFTPGRFDVSVAGPGGRRATLDQAFTVSDRRPAALELELRAPDVLVAGLRPALTVTVHNTGERSAVGLRVAESGLAPATLPAEEIGAGASVAITFALDTEGPGERLVRVRAEARDALSGELLKASAAHTVLVYVPARLQAALQILPSRVTVGQRFEAKLAVTNPGGVEARQVTARIEASGPLKVRRGAPPGAADLESLSTRTFLEIFTALGAGTLTLTASASGIDSLGDVRVAAPSVSLPVIVDAAPELVVRASAPVQVTEGERFDARVELENRGGATLTGTLLTTSSSGAGALTALAPTTPVELPGGATVTMLVPLLATRRGATTLELTATGRDQNSGLLSTALTPLALRVLAPAGLSARLVAPLPRVSTGQRFDVPVEVSNTGETAASAVRLVAAAASGTGSATAGALPAPASLAPGAITTLTVPFVATGAGAATLALELSAEDGVTHALLQSRASGALTIDAAASLALSAALPSMVSVGQRFTVLADVTNSGDAPALGASLSLSTSGAGGVTVDAVAPAADVPAHGARSMVTGLTATRRGAVDVALSASAREGNSGDPVAAGPVAAGRLTVQDSAALDVRVSVAPQVSVGQRFSVNVTVSNQGEADARDVAVTVSSSSAAITLDPPPAPVRIAGGATRVFVVSALSASAGAVQLTAKTAGLDANSAAPLSATASASLQSQRAAALSLSFLPPPPALLDEGQAADFTLRLVNTGEATAGAATILLGETGVGAATFTPAPGAVTLAGGATRDILFTLTGKSAGQLGLEAIASAADANSGSPVSAIARTSLQVLRPAALSSALLAPATVNVGQLFPLGLEVQNGGQAKASAVTPLPLQLSGAASAGCTTGGPSPASSDIAALSSVTFGWKVKAIVPGLLAISSGAAGLDAVSAAAISTSASTQLLVQRPARLTGALRVAPTTSPSSTLVVTLDVQNAGEAMARAVTAAAPTLGGPGSAQLLSSAAGPVDVPAGATASLTFTYDVRSTGFLRFDARAAGTDLNDGTRLDTGLLTATTVSSDAERLAQDPLGDGTSVSNLFSSRGRIYVAPDRSGAGGVRFLPDGTAPESVLFAFAADRSGSRQTANTSAAPYPSLGAPGCTPDTASCGPNNEDARGYLHGVTVGGQEWIFAGGGSASRDVEYVYLSPDSDPLLDFSFVELGALARGTTHSVVRAHGFKSALYYSLLDLGGNRPELERLVQLPTSPGIEPVVGSQLEDLRVDKIPGIGASATVGMLEWIGDFNDRLYIANSGAFARATLDFPRSAALFPQDWKVITPSASAYAGRASTTTSRLTGLEPRDKAVPAMAVFKGRLYAGRNTTNGPQLWGCDPALSESPTDCDAGDWFQVAPNTSGSSQQTYFNEGNNKSITLLAATERFLYAGFDNDQGIEVYRTEALAPQGLSDFTGEAGCRASNAPSCRGVAGPGLGDATNGRIFDATTAVQAGRGYLYLLVGSGSSPLSLYRLAD